LDAASQIKNRRHCEFDRSDGRALNLAVLEDEFQMAVGQPPVASAM
jgi:hypothetical protein